MDWNKIKLVSLDVDGTLYSLPRMRWHVTALILERLLRQPGRAQSDLQRIRYFHRQMNGFRQKQNPFEPAEFPDLLSIENEQLRDWYGTAIARSGPRDGVIPFLQKLKTKNIPCIACSDYICDYKLQALGLSEYFVRLYEGSRVGQLKPLPAIMMQIKQDYGLAWDEILHIGDHPVKDGSWQCQTHIVGKSFADLLKTL